MTKSAGGAKTKFGRLFSFAVAGGTGMIVDLSVLRLVIELFDATPFIARIPAIATAMAATWFINRNYTFGDSGHSIRGEGARYFAVAVFAACLNYLIYSGILVIAPPGFLPEVATIIAVCFVTAVSYLGYSKLVFGK